MGELFELLKQGQNWLYASFITFSACLWLISALGLLGGQAEADLEADAELEADLDADLETEGNFSIGHLFSQVSTFLGIGKVPLTVVLTVLLFGQGVLGIGSNYFLNVIFQTPSSWISHILVFLGSFTGSFFGTAFVTKLLSPIFKDYGKVSKANEMVGQMAILTSSRVSTQFGQATVKLPNGDRVEIAVRTYQENSEIGYGASLLIVDYLPDKNIYLIEKID